MKKFQLQGHDFIELNKLLKILNLVGTGGEANVRIEQGEVQVNEVVERQKRKKLRAGDRVVFLEHSITIE